MKNETCIYCYRVVVKREFWGSIKFTMEDILADVKKVLESFPLESEISIKIKRELISPEDMKEALEREKE